MINRKIDFLKICSYLKYLNLVLIYLSEKGLKKRLQIWPYLTLSQNTSKCLRKKILTMREKEKNEEYFNKRNINYALLHQFKRKQEDTSFSLAMPSGVHTIDLCSVVQPFPPKFHILLLFQQGKPSRHQTLKAIFFFLIEEKSGQFWHLK